MTFIALLQLLPNLPTSQLTQLHDLSLAISKQINTQNKYTNKTNTNTKKQDPKLLLLALYPNTISTETLAYPCSLLFYFFMRYIYTRKYYSTVKKNETGIHR